jgi:hypothetical protein
VLFHHQPNHSGCGYLGGPVLFSISSRQVLASSCYLQHVESSMVFRFCSLIFIASSCFVFGSATQADVIAQLQGSEGAFITNNDASLTSFTNGFDDGLGFTAGNRYFYSFDGVNVFPAFDESIGFSSTTHVYDLDDVTWDYIEFSGGGPADTGNTEVELFVNNVSVGIQSTPTTAGDNFEDARLTWDLSSVAAGSSFDLRFNIAEAGGGDVSFFELVNNDVAGDEFRDGLTVNGTITAIPEPTSFALLGIAGLFAVAKRRRYKSAR